MLQKPYFDQRSSDTRVPFGGVDNAASPKKVATEGAIEFCRKNERGGRRNPADRGDIRVVSDPSPCVPTLPLPIRPVHLPEIQ